MIEGFFQIGGYLIAETKALKEGMINSITNLISRNQLDQPGYSIYEIESSEALTPKRR